MKKVYEVSALTSHSHSDRVYVHANNEEEALEHAQDCCPGFPCVSFNVEVVEDAKLIAELEEEGEILDVDAKVTTAERSDGRETNMPKYEVVVVQKITHVDRYVVEAKDKETALIIVYGNNPIHPLDQFYVPKGITHEVKEFSEANNWQDWLVVNELFKNKAEGGEVLNSRKEVRDLLARLEPHAEEV